MAIRGTTIVQSSPNSEGLVGEKSDRVSVDGERERKKKAYRLVRLLGPSVHSHYVIIRDFHPPKDKSFHSRLFYIPSIIERKAFNTFYPFAPHTTKKVRRMRNSYSSALDDKIEKCGRDSAVL